MENPSIREIAMKKSNSVHPFTLGLMILWVSVLALLTACSSQVTPAQIIPTQTAVTPTQVLANPTRVVVTFTQVPNQPIAINTSDDFYALLRKISKSSPSSGQALVDDLWQRLVKSRRVPLLLGDHVFFLYKGEAESVEWRGAFN
jgi:hypothetical protein